MEPFQKVEFIRKIHLFRGLSDEELTSIAGELVEKSCKPGDVIVHEGDEADLFYLVYRGKVTVTRRKHKGQQKLADLVDRDAFGEDALVKKSRRTATVTAAEETILLSLARPQFQALLKKVPGLKTKFEVSVASHRLVRRKRFSWQEEGEVVYFIARKHPILLLKSLSWPVLSFLLPALALILYLGNPVNFFLWMAGIVGILSGLAILFAWVDWSNDYYIVTNRRVIYLEKIILIYDSRQEAPLTAILSVNTQSDVLGRTIGYGDVIIRTFVGNIIFRTIAYPEEVETLVRDYWDRTRDVSRRANIEAMKQAIRQKLGIVAPTAPTPAPALATKPGYTFSMFKIRFEEKGIITYRKHWFVLIKQTWLPGLLTLTCLGLLIRDFLVNGFKRDGYAVPEILFVTLIPLFIWWLYQAVDWSNDKFQVTSDQIFDIDKTPFGRTQKNVAPLDNILSMEARREGLLQVLFNYGNVYITVGGAQMVFEDVINPDAVQQDIDQRRVARREKQDQERSQAERDRLAEFFAAYHQTADSFRQELDEKEREKSSSSPSDGQSDVK